MILVRNTEFIDRIDDFIDLFETRFARDILSVGGLADLEKTTTFLATAEFENLPADYNGLRGISIEFGGIQYPLNYATPLEIDIHEDGGSGSPFRYTIVGNQLRFNPPPDSGSTYTVTLDYYGTLLALSDANPTNFLFTSNPRIYLAGCLVEAFLFQYEEQRAALWEQQYVSELKNIRNLDRNKRWAGHPKYMRPS